jgi:hypothetical protein
VVAAKRDSSLEPGPAQHQKTRHQQRPLETGSRNGASIAKFRTRIPSDICGTARYRARSSGLHLLTVETGLTGWGGRIRTSASGICVPLPRPDPTYGPAARSKKDLWLKRGAAGHHGYERMRPHYRTDLNWAIWVTTAGRRHANNAYGLEYLRVSVPLRAASSAFRAGKKNRAHSSQTSFGT